jgi:hypothetical protein
VHPVLQKALCAVTIEGDAVALALDGLVGGADVRLRGVLQEARI